MKPDLELKLQIIKIILMIIALIIAGYAIIFKLWKGSNTMSEKAPIIKKAVEILRREGIKVFFKKVLSYSSYLGLKYLCIPILPFALLKIKYLNKKN